MFTTGISTTLIRRRQRRRFLLQSPPSAVVLLVVVAILVAMNINIRVDRASASMILPLSQQERSRKKTTTSSSSPLPAGSSAVSSSCTSSPQSFSTRRAFVSGLIAVTGSSLVSTASDEKDQQKAFALDVDAFVNSQLDDDTKKSKMSDDEARCRYGAPDEETGAACVRAGVSSKRAKTLDAFGNTNRGDFVRCKTIWENPDGKGYVKRTECK